MSKILRIVFTQNLHFLKYSSVALFNINFLWQVKMEVNSLMNYFYLFNIDFNIDVFPDIKNNTHDPNHNVKRN